MIKINIENYSMMIDNLEFEVVTLDDGEHICETEYESIKNININISEYPEKLRFDIHDPTGFDTYLFHELYVTKENDSIKFFFNCLHPNKYWENKWGLSTFLVTLSEIIKDSQVATVEYISVDSDWKELKIFFLITEDFIFQKQIDELTAHLKNFIKQAERQLSGSFWRKELETNEGLFCTDILYPLLRKMGFIDVRYRHGTKEYGKDFTFSEQTKFGNLRHFGLQAKAGNLRGNVNSYLDEIIGQLNDAFSMSYHEITANENRQISTFIIAISGQFTDNAKDKIIEKIPKQFKGAVYFVDRDKINELIEKYWK